MIGAHLAVAPGNPAKALRKNGDNKAAIKEEVPVNTLKNSRKALYLSVGFLAGILFISSCTGGNKAVAEYIGMASDIIFDSSTNSLVAEDVQLAIEQVNVKADVNLNSLSSVASRIATNEADITTINSRQILTDVDDGSMLITPYNTYIATGMSIEASGRGRDMMVTASINVDNTSNSSELVATFDLRFDEATRRTESVVIKGDGRQLVTIQWLERNVTTGTHYFDVRVSSTNAVTLQNRYFYCIEL